jgi:sortase A
VGRVVVCVIVVAALGAWQWNPATAWFNDRDSANRTQEYARIVAQTPTAEQEAMLAAATEYNEWLASGGAASLDTDLTQLGAVDTSTPEYERYASLLSLAGTSIMAHLTVGSINASLPVVHGTAPEALDVSAGHLYGTSLPVGGPSTHAVIAAHSGWSKATLFNDLSKVEEGDTFTVSVMGRSLTYQVDQIQATRAGESTDLLTIEDGKDYVTLTTCYPTFVNTHRLLVRGVRIATADAEDTTLARVAADPGFPWWAVIVASGAAAVVALAFMPPKRRRSTAEHRLADGNE